AVATEVVNAPGVSRVQESPMRPSVGQRPVVGRHPTTPHRAAGMATDPPVSVPMAAGTWPRATAAAQPPLEPPALWVASAGLRTGPVWGLSLVIPKASSCILLMPATTAPWPRRAATIPLSAPARLPCSAGDEAETSMP